MCVIFGQTVALVSSLKNQYMLLINKKLEQFYAVIICNLNLSDLNDVRTTKTNEYGRILTTGRPLVILDHAYNTKLW